MNPDDLKKHIHGTNNNFIELWKDDFDDYDRDRWSKASHSFDGNNADFTYANVEFEYGYMILCLTTPGDIFVNFNVYDLNGSVVYNSNLNHQTHSENNIFGQ